MIYLQILQFLTELAAEHTQLNAHDLMDTLLAREKLGSTGVGHGVAGAGIGGGKAPHSGPPGRRSQPERLRRRPG